MLPRAPKLMAAFLLVSAIFPHIADAQAARLPPDVTVDRVVHTYLARPGTNFSGRYFDKFRQNIGHRFDCKEKGSPFNVLSQLLDAEGTNELGSLSDKNTAYLLHVAQWAPTLLGTYQIAEDDWVAYKRVKTKDRCYFQSTGSKKNTTNDPLLYGIKTIVFLGINQFQGAPDLNTISVGYDISTTPDIPQNVQDLGSLLYALLGATLPTSTVQTGGGGREGNKPDVLVAAALIDNNPRLPFFINISLSASMVQLGGLPNAQIGLPYAASVTASGGNGVYNYVVTKGNLPDGIVLDSQSGSISGIPTTRASTKEFTILATDTSSANNSQILQTQIIVKPSTIVNFPAIVQRTAQISGGLTHGGVGSAYRSYISANGGNPPYAYAITKDSKGVFDGLVLNQTTGEISGTPAKATVPGAVLSFTITDSSVPPITWTTTPVPFTIEQKMGLTPVENTAVASLASQPPPTVAASLPTAYVGVPYLSAIVATGGKDPYKYACGSLPDGISVNPSTGVVSGNPTQPMDATLNCTISDSTVVEASPVQSLREVLANVALSIKSNEITVKLAVIGGTLGSSSDKKPYVTTVTFPGALPETQYSCPECGDYGFKITNSGELSGNAEKAGIMSVITTTSGNRNALPVAIDPASTQTPESISLIPTEINELSGPLLTGLVGKPYSVTLEISNAKTPDYIFSCASCKSGVSVLPAGELHGTPKNSGAFFSTINVYRPDAKVTYAVPVELSVAAPGLTLTLSAGSSVPQGQPNSSGQAIQNAPQVGSSPPPSGGKKNQTQATGNGNGQAQTNQTGSPQSGTSSGAAPGVKCAFSVASPCTFSRTLRSDDREFLDFSMGVVIPGPKERLYSSPSTSSITTHTDAYALLDLFPFFTVSPKNGVAPHFVMGLPVTSQVFHRPVFGVSENFTGWTGLEKLGFPATSFFAGVVYMQQQVLISSGVLRTDRALKPVYGIEVSLSSLISKIGGAAKGSGAKGSGTKV